MANEKIINKILGELYVYNQMENQLLVLTPDGKKTKAVLPFNQKQLLDYVIFGLEWAVNNIPLRKAKMFYARNKGHFFDLVMQAQVDALTQFQNENKNKIGILFWQFASGLEIVFDYLDDYAPLDSKKLEMLPYKDVFCRKLITDYKDIHPVHFYTWYVFHVKRKIINN